MRWSTKPKWSFVIDTDAYSGNFERAMTGYITGLVDDYGEHMAEPYIKLYGEEEPEDPLGKIVEFRVREHDGNGFSSPCDILPTTEDGEYNSVVIFLQEKPSEKELALLASRARKFSDLPKLRDWGEHRPKILGCRLVQEETTYTAMPV